MSLAALLARELPLGVYRLPGPYDGEQVERLALDAGWLFAPAWGAGTQRDMLAALGDALGLGDHAGRNLDALADCLRDLVGDTLLMWADWAVLAEKDPAGLGAIVDVLGSAERLAVVLVGGGPEIGVPALGR